MNEIDCGSRSETTSIAEPSKPKDDTTYPSFSVSGDVAEAMDEAYDMEVGDEVECKVRLRKTGMTDDQYGKRATFDVLALITDGEEASAGEEEEEEPEEEPEEKPKFGRRSRNAAAQIGRM